MISIAGGTSRLGLLVVARLRERGLAVRVLTRDPGKAAHLGPLGVEVRQADVRRPDSLAEALTGSSVVVSAIHGFLGPRGISPRTVDDLGNRALFDAAAVIAADVVMVSVMGAAADSPLELFRAKHSAERHLRGLGVPWTIVRSSAFLETWTDLMRETTTPGGRTLVFGRGANPVNFVPVGDVADVVADAVARPDLRGQVVQVVGPEDLTLTELAVRVASADARPIRPRHVPPTVLKVVAATLGRLSPQLGRQARAALAMDVTDLRAPVDRRG